MAVNLVAKPVVPRDKDGLWMKPRPDGHKKVVTMALPRAKALFAPRPESNIRSEAFPASG